MGLSWILMKRIFFYTAVLSLVNTNSLVKGSTEMSDKSKLCNPNAKNGGTKTSDPTCACSSIKKEAIPLVFIPGIMGSVLRLKGTNGKGKGANRLPNLRWNPSSMNWMLRKYGLIAGAAKRRNMLIGPCSHNKDYLEVHNSNPVGNGFQGVASSSYKKFLRFLERRGTWGTLLEAFDFPVYAVGYNWTDSSLNNGKLLATRIDEIIKEAKQKTGDCKKVILITHSMGGFVSRVASEIYHANSKLMGIIHGVQMVNGAAAAYWRIKAGFETKSSSRVLGNSAKMVTPLLGNMPGGLELLPNKNYTNNNGKSEWLSVYEKDKKILSLPKKDPYCEIYRVKGTGSQISHPDRKYWGLIDPDLLDPKRRPCPKGTNPNDPNALNTSTRLSPWDQYLICLRQGEAFHEKLGTKIHPTTYMFHGTGSNKTADRIVMITEPEKKVLAAYKKRKFRGRFTNAAGKATRAVLQKPNGSGDGTVSISTGSALDSKAKKPPAPRAIRGPHEGIYKKSASQDFVSQAVISLCKNLYEKKCGKKFSA